MSGECTGTRQTSQKVGSDDVWAGETIKEIKKRKQTDSSLKLEKDDGRGVNIKSDEIKDFQLM